MGKTVSVAVPDRTIGLIIFGAGLLLGFLVTNFSHERKVEDCHDQAAAKEFLPSDRYTGSAFEFAKCMSPRRYDPMYDYNRFKVK